MIALLTTMLLLQDKVDVERVKAVDAFERAFRTAGLPAKGQIRVPRRIIKCADVRAFAATYAPQNGAVLTVSSTGTTWTLAGGRCGEDGVPVALFGPRKGIVLVVGGPRKSESTSSEAIWSMDGFYSYRGSKEEPEWAFFGVANDLIFSIFRGTPPNNVITGVPESESVKEDPLTIKGAKTLAKDLEDLAAVWAKATKENRLDLSRKLADTYRPTSGALTAVNKDGSFVVMIGADGTPVFPDGVGVEVSGKAATTVVLIPGRPKGDGKPGVARGEGAFVVEAK